MRIFVNEYCGHPFPIELSRELARRGHDVCHVYFADNHSTPKGEVTRRAGDPATLCIEGLHIQRAFSKHSLLTRILTDIEYGKVTTARMEKFAPDVVLSANMPLSAQKILQTATLRRQAQFIFWLQDIYSIAIRFVLKKKAPLLTGTFKYFEYLEKRMLRQSSKTVCIAEGFREILQEWKVPASRIAVIENWAPLGEVIPTTKENAWSREQGFEGKFCFMYSGTLGMKHRPELLLELARRLEGRNDARLVVIAGGAGVEWLKQHAGEVSSEVLTILGFQPYQRLSEVMGAADVLITLLDSEAGAFAVPSKVLSYLCAGRASLVAAPDTNNAAQIIVRANAGLVVSADKPEAFVQAAFQLLSDSAACARYGQNARLYAQGNFAIDGIADRMMKIIDDARR